MATPPDLTKIPLAVNPSGAPPNFDNPPTLVDEARATGVALIVLGGLCLAFRLGTNLKLSKTFCLDDYLCIFAFAGGIALWILYQLNSEDGLARHMWDTPMSTFTIAAMQRLTAILFVLALTLWASKSAILALYIRIFGTITWLRRTCWVWMVCMALFYSLNIVAAGAYCVPRTGEMWGGNSFSRCSSSAWLHVIVGGFSVAADLIILILPFPVVMRMRISVAKKVTLGFVFGTGVILVVLSVVSLWLRVIIFKGQDSTWNATLLQMVSIVEIFGTISVACAPAMSAFWLNIFTKTSLWTQITSSSVFSYLQSRMSPSRSHVDENPSFVSPPRVASSLQSPSAAGSEKGSRDIVKMTSYAVVDDENSLAPSVNHSRV
ncbi:hypothetical protein K504DRAFT_415182 [Pleomassaria siparia CBS 279.74]|uniref:Rhodopsin domain-containing protein n=1 Tax=Pleomassaria siparia CBS 279.74 TaxID=1314801 RepID=A0A6G1JYM9_9PLEO|nr:hypothetical protein K504DRAFT_415182 [Pleomassaria siparia CBS 279.74]